jgi:hypothetical protein
MEFRTNVETGKKIPLVPYDPAYPDAVRYYRTGTGGCHKGEEGPLMSHFVNCKSANQFSGRNRK